MTENIGNVTQSGKLLLDARLWGKSRGLSREYPVICHLLDTAATAGVLWGALVGPQMRRRIAGELGLPEEACRRVVSFWAGLHDIGKITASFQSQVPVAFAGVAADVRYPSPRQGSQGLRHEVATHWALVELLAAWGYPQDDLVRYSSSHQVAQLLGGHHGCFGAVLQQKEVDNAIGYQPGLGEGGWRAQRAVHAAAVRELTGGFDVPVDNLSGGSAVVVAGLVVVADWLVSQEAVIESRLPAPGWSGAGQELAAHWQESVGLAPGLVREAGLGRAFFPQKGFEEQFPFPPNPLQADLAERLPALVRGPGLLLVTAPTGDGKTEAALHAASVVARASGAGGVYFALPTMATADAMFGRVRDFAVKNVEGERGLTLLHSMAWLSPAYEEADAGSRVVSGGASSTEAGRWLRTGRRGLLAPLCAGTIDQALTGVLPVRYNVLRLLGLSSKVLVVDEAHAYGPWMHSLLVRLLEWLGALRAPVVLLSATLTGRAASSLVEAYRRGAGFRDPVAVEPRYPGWLWVDATTGEVPTPRQVGTKRRRTLSIEPRLVVWDVQDDPRAAIREGGRREVLRELLAPVVEEGGCVLVCCTTVDEAQRTFRDLRVALPGLADREGGLRLLHSRFPAWQRQEISQACEVQYGKPRAGEPAGGGRVGSVLVATQIVEQSLDLDFDLVVSDLAPLAQLLQRAGRGKRHDRPGGRPVWAGGARDVRLVVLEPAGDGGVVEAPRSWGAVYDGSLLTRTSELLGGLLGQAVAVPAGVQALVDAVYSEDFGERLESAAKRERLARLDALRVGTAAAEGQLANLVAVPSPRDVQGDLSCLSTADPGVTEELLTTRLGADSGRAVVVYVQEGGERTLDAAGEGALPRGGRLSRGQVASVVRHTVPLPGRWLVGLGEEHAAPAAWRDRPVLQDLVLVPVSRAAGGRWVGRLGAREVEISDVGISGN
ncbi:CRISPR-associated helicase Cas3' [Kitasatospora indigofera]|uniref:CRISPR-associated helicase Cas3' n=1 Tax=Kitasatospora indigofera TaxID=67307 RepID=UPI0036699CD2